MSFLRKPQNFWFRKALFQIHLWTGLILGLYMLVIGTTGAILVFEKEWIHLEASKSPSAQATRISPVSDLPSMAERVQATFPHDQLLELYLPTSAEPDSRAYIHTRSDEYFYAIINHRTGAVAKEPYPQWLLWVGNLHFNLLAGDTGRLLNGIGASFLLILCVSGLVIWWPGIKRWKRSLGISFGRGWKSINWHIHSAVGFWALALLSVWAVSGIEFVWPKQFRAVVNQISSLSSTISPKFVVPPRSNGNWPSLAQMVERAKEASPGSQLHAVSFPESARDALTFYMSPDSQNKDSIRMDLIYFDPSTGRQLALWHRGVNPTPGSRFMSWLGPLHYGTQWGLAVKIVWAACGLALPLLFLTGTLMYWNRTLSKKWRAIGKRLDDTHEPSENRVLIHGRNNDTDRPHQAIEGMNNAKAYEES